MTDGKRKRIAATLVVLGLVLNHWLLGALLTRDGTVDELWKIAAVLFVQSTLVLTGVGLWLGWIPRAPGGGRANAGPAAIVVGCALAIALACWGIAAYEQSHDHTVLAETDAAKVTPEQRAWAEDFYQRSLDAALRNGWFDYETAMQQGFQEDRVNRTHYPNLEYMFDDVILDPERPEWLIYHDGPDGKVLMAFMFFTRTLDEVGPTPGGPLALWHYHPYDKPRCAIKGIWTVGKPDGEGRCAEGIPVMKTPEMLHVWFIDHPLGRFTEMKIVSEFWQESDFDVRHLHPIFVHFTIALIVVFVLLDFIGLFTRNPAYHFAAWINLIIAAIFTVATVAAGMAAEVMLKPSVAAHDTLDVHRTLAFAVSGVLALLLIWRIALRGRFPKKGGAIYGAMGILAIALTAGTGYYGGEMVYQYGAGVRIIDDFARRNYWEKVKRDYSKPPEPASEGG